MAEASARMSLREYVCATDIDLVISIVIESFRQRAEDIDQGLRDIPTRATLLSADRKSHGQVGHPTKCMGKFWEGCFQPKKVQHCK